MSVHTTRNIALFAATALTAAYAAPAMAQDAADTEDDVIIVTAQRVEQDIQDVPISITYFSPQKLADNNIVSLKDIATLTPGVYAQTRFGNDVTTYTIRGFAQEQRTTATVGVYFAEVVAPRGNGVSQGGDGASPGALFDLENVQVLKGPQGTLFGRNTTGGAVLLVPVKPKDDFEGYVEGTLGNLNRWRIQGVVNLPVSETFRLRLGVDRHKRDGYIKNIGVSPRHDEDMGSIDIMAFRASAVWDITPDIENYTIFSYSESKGSGAIPLIKQVYQTAADAKCVPPVLSAACSLAFRTQAASQVAAESKYGWWTGTNSNRLAESYFEELRVINRTTVDLSDSITLTNLFGFSRLKGNNAIDAFGLNAFTGSTATNPDGFFSFVPIVQNPDFGLTANQEAIVEELRLTGETDRLRWQAGLYYEKSTPRDFTGTMSVTAGSCLDALTFKCSNGTGATISSNKVWNETLAAYAQATYDITDQLAITAGIRYTEDKTRALFSNGRVRFTPATNWVDNTYECGFPGHPDAGPNPVAVTLRYPNTLANRASKCFFDTKTKTSAPTWLINLDYKPIEDMLIYAKWSRGYRQGGLVPPTGLIDLIPYSEEKVDAFEVGAKTSWSGGFRGTFNVAAFLNKFTGQQIQAGINNADNSIQTTAIVNGNSKLYGLEAELMIEPVEGFRLEAAYSYNHTKLQKISYPDLTAFGLVVRQLPVGGPLPLAVPHAFNATVSYKLPVSESMGDISISGTVVHMSSFRAVADTFFGTNLGILPKRTFGNVNLNWKNIGGGPIDAAVSVTNVTNEKMYTHVNEQSTRGFLAYSVDEPRQYMVRVKYRFGALAD